MALFFHTVVLRPYVFAFLAVYLVAATAHLNLRRALLFVPLGYALAWLSEYCSIHWGFPYGAYFYIQTTRSRELWVAGVPFMDSLSYVFLAYCSYATALFLVSPLKFTDGDFFLLETRRHRRSPVTLLVSSLLFVLLDIVIDPVSLEGRLWFLGQIYGYPEKGFYFGVPLSNFGGWLVVGVAMTATLQLLDRCSFLESSETWSLTRIPMIHLLGVVLYLSVLGFNLGVTVWIGDYFLAETDLFLVFFPLLIAAVLTGYKQRYFAATTLREHLADFPRSKASRLLDSAAPDPALLQ